MTRIPGPDDSLLGSTHATVPGGAGNSGLSGDERTRSAARFTAPILSHPGPAWDDLDILEELGSGAYGRVYRVRDAALARDVALKIIKVRQDDPAAVASVLSEGRMLARVRHRNVVTVYRAEQRADDVALWMEFVRGRSLRQMVREEGPLGADEAAVIGVSVCEAVAAVHAAGLLHRDVKAQNVMRESGGRIVLMDFGAGRDLAAGPATPGEIAGTPIYMSPDVLSGAPWTPSADVYSIGVLLFFLVTGRYPVDGRSLADIVVAHAEGRQQLLIDCRPGLPEPFVRVVQRALASGYQSAGAMLGDLAGAMPGASTARAEAIPASAHASRSSATAIAPANQASTLNAPFAGPIALPGTIAGAAASIWLFGFLTSTVFDQTLGRDASFANEGIGDQFYWGARALFSPLSYMVLAFVAARFLGFAWNVLLRLVPPLGRAAHAARERLRPAGRRMGLLDRNTQAQWLLALQLVSVAGVLWLFGDFLRAMTSFLATAPAGALAQLSPTNDAHVVYRMVLSVLLFVMAAAWLRILSRRPGQPAVDRATTAAGLTVMFAALVLLTMPFRLVHHASFPRVDVDGERCYRTGERGAEVLLFCPGSLPRTRIVPAGSNLLQGPATLENVFAAPVPLRH